jgi:hypothetical protein
MERQLSVSFHFLKIYMNASEAPPHCYPRERSDKEKFNDFMERYLTPNNLMVELGLLRTERGICGW